MRQRRFHLIGIAGDGMSALARLLLEAGYAVSGSDIADDARLQPLRRLGAHIAIGHDARLIAGADIVVASPAIPRHNAELQAARELGMQVWPRAKALVDFLRHRQAVCVSGSHGKTTTSAMLASILDRAGRNPGFMIGGTTASLGGVNARCGDGDLFIAEACEAFRALDHWQPSHCIVTNVDDEHTDHYGGLLPLHTAFSHMLRRVPKDGLIAVCGDDLGAMAVSRDLQRTVISYGLGPNNSLRASAVQLQADASVFDVFCDGGYYGSVRLAVPGLHNIRNALAAVAIALGLGVPFAAAAAALGDFIGVERRWQLVGEACGVRVFNDFAHHPTEIEATLSVARKAVSQGGKVVVAFEPQLHSRVGRLAAQFVAALSAADLVFVTPVDPAGEAPALMRGDDPLAAAMARSRTPLRRIPDTASIPAAVLGHLREGDILITMGPGRVAAMGPAVLAALHGERCRTGNTELAVALTLPHPAPPAILDTRLLHHFFEEQAVRTPEAVCIEDGGVIWTYGQLDAYANQAARVLIGIGIGADSLVVLHLERSMRLIALILGVLKAGAAYVPLDPSMGDGRLRVMLENSGAGLMISEQNWAPENAPVEKVVLLKALWPAIQAEECSRPPCAAAPHHLAYAIFTSGSTGKPKLVGVEHCNIANLIDYATRELLDADDLRVVPFIDAISFDSCVHQIFTTLAHGGRLLLESDLASLLLSSGVNRITSLGSTPSILGKLLDAVELPRSVRVLALGGEVIPEALVARIRDFGSVRKALNYYGPTETTIYSTVAWLIDPRCPKPLTISGELTGRILGHPIQNTRVYVLDESGRAVPVGEVGEIHIAGAGVVRGYLGAPDLTAERFGPDPFSDEPDARCYRTGDRGRLLPDGAIEFIGRLDGQFKLRGVRLEPEEIEAYIGNCPGVRQAVVELRKVAHGSPQLVAYIVADPHVELSKLRSFLQARIPAVMIPTTLMKVGYLPLTVGGKVDRAALAMTDLPDQETRHLPVPPRNDVEARLLAIWQTVLERGPLGVTDDFFSLGGDSLRSMDLLIKVESEFGIRLKPETYEALGTVADMAPHIERMMKEERPAGGNDERAIDEILRKQRMYITSWIGKRHGPGSLIVTLNQSGRRQGLFWCLQGYEELTQLAAGLGNDQPVHGLRSGHLVMRYTDENIKTLVAHYVDEMIAIQLTGPFYLGGNCQGGTIARAIALKLRALGRQVSKLFLMEQNSFPHYDAPVTLLFGHDSGFNPYRRFSDPDAVFRASYPAGYVVDMINGTHGRFFDPENIGSLTAAIRKQI
jgi:UDP-N-acetylmuramate--L-alanine ligase